MQQQQVWSKDSLYARGPTDGELNYELTPPQYR
jgi:hypothetical protein